MPQIPTLAALVMSCMSSQIPTAIWLNFTLKGMMPGWMVGMPLMPCDVVLSTARDRQRSECPVSSVLLVISLFLARQASLPSEVLSFGI